LAQFAGTRPALTAEQVALFGKARSESSGWVDGAQAAINQNSQRPSKTMQEALTRYDRIESERLKIWAIVLRGSTSKDVEEYKIRGLPVEANPVVLDLKQMIKIGR